MRSGAVQSEDLTTEPSCCALPIFFRRSHGREWLQIWIPGSERGLGRESGEALSKDSRSLLTSLKSQVTGNIFPSWRPAGPSISSPGQPQDWSCHSRLLTPALSALFSLAAVILYFTFNKGSIIFKLPMIGLFILEFVFIIKNHVGL